ncbi:MAG: homoserine dehydrogenase [Pseudomonadales bacterium]|nr:homoserine dehydrogenase [Pseudomonadales bacterium]
MLKPVNIGICGLGTVGGGTFNVLARNHAQIAARTGCDIRVSHVAIRQAKPEFDLSNVTVESDVLAVARAPEVDIVVETIGGYDAAKRLVLTAIEHGKHVVTANKALIAEHGNEIFSKAAEHGVSVYFEAAVAGGIPVIKALREGLAGNQIDWLAGIINGTGNFILTEMKDKGRDFADVLAEAQALGYAEADPTFDVEGIDACHKLAILASLAFGVELSFDRAYTEGISQVAPLDVVLAEELGFNIKHLGIARQLEQGIELRVHPTLIPKTQLLANVHGVMNAVMIHADAVGSTMYYGAGAGAEPTASSIVADICDIARLLDASQAQSVPPLSFAQASIQPATILPIEQVRSEFYLRFSAHDEPGVMMHVTEALSAQGISIETMIQKAPDAAEHSLVALVTDHVEEQRLRTAVAQIETLPTIQGSVHVIRVESLA